ncbi:hypothetical protein BJ742DRAFT_839768 [Cladochytrium replicatum]|nr:hypothetical protein BJ742DRAFT_839768 [Cladochytrium replicatum]
MPNEINPKAVEAAEAVMNAVDGYVPKVVKDASTYAVNTGSAYLPDIAKNIGIYAINTATQVIESGISTATSTQKAISDNVAATREFAAQKVSQTVDLGKVAVSGATTTISAYTPSPVAQLVTSAIDGAKALQKDPVGTVKPYIPLFVINVGEKTYEVVSHTVETTQANISSTAKSVSDTVHTGTGFIVTKVNGTVETITHIPAIQNVIEQIEKLVNPILAKIGAGPKPAAAEAQK